MVVLFLGVLLGIGHVATERGRKTGKLMARKYAMFVLASLGIWTDDLYDAYDIKANVDRMSIAPYKPFKFVRKEIKFQGVETEELYVQVACLPILPCSCSCSGSGSCSATLSLHPLFLYILPAF
jgi:hypothetical protein